MDRCTRLKCLLDAEAFNVLKHLSCIEFKVGKLASAFTWHENAAEKAAQFCHFDFQK